MITRALLSLSDKTGILEFAKFLVSKNIEILSTGGTAELLKKNKIPVTNVSDFTGFPEIFDGRVKTIHPKIHGGLLSLRGNKEHEKIAQENDIQPIDLLVVNLYPFEKIVQKENASEAEIIENIDIGGPSMLRSAAKNFQRVTVIIDLGDLQMVQQEIEANGDTSLETRRTLAGKVFARTTLYDVAISQYFSPGQLHIMGEKIQDLRYGENPHQKAEFYRSPHPFSPSIATAKKIQGKELSFNNILDANAALQILTEFASDENIAVIMKHLNPCGTAKGKTIEQAFAKALEGDPLSAFGGIVAVNQEVSEELATKLTEMFLEIVIAPKFSPESLQIFSKKEKLRILEVGEISSPIGEKDVRSVLGGFLVQDLDTKQVSESDLTVVTKIHPTRDQTQDLLFAAKICRNVKSNAIVLVKNLQTVGVGAGQMSRVDSAFIAITKSGDRSKGSVAASDAFFPFPDAVETLARAGVMAIIHPGGSIRDAEVIQKSDELGIAMVFSGVRAFRH
ncbi:bifunctional phosphoribosylaminoimidazolecarboxamide formyltransferase/IMP cyclohydrolase [Candidatus Peregrinibacteria bacterium]|nr:bifunctional phosphoribosylaminoimidazolecarboxamide formyltransferase/IMP cyclohydrolase [Candidatus Peregrinibacteria bacterium]